jgi:hypothetical protein
MNEEKVRDSPVQIQVKRIYGGKQMSGKQTTPKAGKPQSKGRRSSPPVPSKASAPTQPQLSPMISLIIGILAGGLLILLLFGCVGLAGLLATRLGQPPASQSSSQPAAGSNAASAQFPDISNPRFDEGQDDNSWVSGITHDIGVLPFQVGLIFGTDIEWAGHSFKGGCQLVVLEPGFYPGVKYAGRYEIYDLPRSDPDGWKKVLIQQRIEEQHQNYRCPLKNVEDVPSLRP